MPSGRQSEPGPDFEEFTAIACNDYCRQRMTISVKNGRPHVSAFDAEGQPVFSLLGCRGQALAAAEAVETPTSKPRILPTKN